MEEAGIRVTHALAQLRRLGSNQLPMELTQGHAERSEPASKNLRIEPGEFLAAAEHTILLPWQPSFLVIGLGRLYKCFDFDQSDLLDYSFSMKGAGDWQVGRRFCVHCTRNAATDAR